MDKTMASNDNGKVPAEIREESGGYPGPNGFIVKDQIPLYLSASQKGLLGERNPKKGFLNILTALPSRVGLLKFGSAGMLGSPSAKFRRLTAERDEISRQVPPPTAQDAPDHLSISFTKKIDWESLKKMSKKWVRDPMNMALLVWIICVAVSGAILFLVMTGMLDHALPKKSQRDTWFEVNNQILNALFTLMCLYQHPKRFYQLVLLIRWRPEDVQKLRKIYCKNGTYKPHEWMHMMVIIVLLHLNCFAQYALCGLNLGYKRSVRPAIGVGLCVAVAISAPIIAGVYSILSPLGKEYSSETDQEAQTETTTAELSVKSFEKRYSFVLRDNQRVLLGTQHQWRGGLFDLWDDISVAYLSLFCGFCVFGWNMERIGFGNMYVHIATFLLFCMAPFWIFNLAAVNIDNEVVREALGVTGIVLCVFGLLYGGFWRIQMRKRFNLPPNNFCCGYPAMTDCAQWLCCCMCSLAQEVRTVDFYDIEEDRLYRNDMDNSIQPPFSSLPQEGQSPPAKSSPSSPMRSNLSPNRYIVGNSPSPSRLAKVVEEEVSFRDRTMELPIHEMRSNLSPNRYIVGNSPSPSRLAKMVEEEVSYRDRTMEPPIHELMRNHGKVQPPK